MPALPAGTPLALGGDWNCVAGDQDLVGGQPGTRQSGFHSGLLPLQQALGLLDAFFFFFFFFWVTKEMFILYRQSTDRDTELT